MIDTPLEFNDWLQQRCGRFTSSEDHKLFTSGRREMTKKELAEEKARGGKRKTVDSLFGDPAMSYIYQKVAELLTLEVKQESNFIQTNWGKEHEYDAYMAYEEATKQKGTYYGTLNPKFFEWGKYGGCSPDYIYKKKGADFKCPFNSLEHLKNLQLETQDDFKKLRWEYYCQAQGTMYKLNLISFDFVSYDKRYIDSRLKLKVITILPDKDWQIEYQMRFDKAVEIVETTLKKYNAI